LPLIGLLSRHKTFADYFNALAAAGFQTLPKIIELRVTEEYLAPDRAFFKGAVGYPLQVLLRIVAKYASRRNTCCLRGRKKRSEVQIVSDDDEFVLVCVAHERFV